MREPVRYAIVDGGEGAFIGSAHRTAAAIPVAREVVPLSDERTEFIAIVTPNHRHAPVAIAALDAGLPVPVWLQMDGSGGSRHEQTDQWHDFEGAGQSRYRLAALDSFRNGGRVPRLPPWSGSVGLNMRGQAGNDWELSGNAAIEFRSRSLLTVATSTVPETAAFAKLNMRIAALRPADGLEIAVIGRNLNDKRIASFGFPLPNVAGAAVLGTEMPRTIALQLSIRR